MRLDFNEKKGMLVIKKIISITVALLVILTGVQSFAKDAPDKTNLAWEVVTGLDFIDSEKEATDLVTRAEFATTVLKLYGEKTAGDFDEGSDTPYSDVLKEHYKSTDIKRSYELGFVRGYDDGKFYPENEVQLVQAMKIIVDLLGYQDYVLYRGGYPFAYMSEGAKLGISSGISRQFNESITYYEFARMIYNAMEEAIVEVNAIEEGNVTFNKDRDATFLSKYHDIYKAEGVVTANPYTKVNGTASIGDKKLEINDFIYVTKTDIFNQYVGYNCEYYYEDTGRDTPVLKFAVPVDNESGEIKGRNIVGTTKNTIKFLDENEDVDYIELSENGNVIYNGIYASKVINYDLEKLVDFSGKIVVCDTDSNGEYDMIFVTEYKNYILDKVLLSENKIFVKDEVNSYIVDITNNTFVTATKGGEICDLSALESGTLISVASSGVTPSGRKNISVVVSDKTVTANVTSLSDNEATLSYQKGSNQIDENYRISKNFIGENGAKIAVRGSGSFHIDALGEIGYFKVGENTGFQYGYVIATHTDKKFDGELKIKMLSSSGEILYFYTADKVNVDGDKVERKNIANILESSSTITGTVKQLIRYDVNKEGLISHIDTVLENSDGDSLALRKEEIGSSGATYKNGMKTFVISGSTNRYILGSATKLFLIPTGDGASDDDYQVRTNSYFTDASYGKSSSGEKLIMYNVEDAEPKVVELRVEAVSGGLGGVSQYGSDLAIVKGKAKVINDEGEERVAIKVMVTNAEKTLPITDKTKLLRFEDGSITNGTALHYDDVTPLTVDDFKFGDAVLYAEDERGDVRTLLRVSQYNVADCAADGTEEGPIYKYGSENRGSYLERTRASVRKIDGRKVLLDVGEGQDNLMWMNLVGSIQVYLVDTEKETVSIASFNDIIASEHDSYADKILIRIRNYVTKQVVIYR